MRRLACLLVMMVTALVTGCPADPNDPKRIPPGAQPAQKITDDVKDPDPPADPPKGPEGLEDPGEADLQRSAGPGHGQSLHAPGLEAVGHDPHARLVETVGREHAGEETGGCDGRVRPPQQAQESRLALDQRGVAIHDRIAFGPVSLVERPEGRAFLVTQPEFRADQIRAPLADHLPALVDRIVRLRKTCEQAQQ